MENGIAIYALARELGVGSGLIVEWCRMEGLGNTTLSGRSKISFGLAETIREIFSHAAVRVTEMACDPQD